MTVLPGECWHRPSTGLCGRWGTWPPRCWCTKRWSTAACNFRMSWMRMTRFGARAERNGERRSWRNAESCQATESHRPDRCCCCCCCCHPLKSRLAVTTKWVVSYIACIKNGVNKICNPLLQCDIGEKTWLGDPTCSTGSLWVQCPREVLPPRGLSQTSLCGILGRWSCQGGPAPFPNRFDKKHRNIHAALWAYWMEHSTVGTLAQRRSQNG